MQRSHPAPPNWLVSCKGCHSAKCFGHILEWFIHASEALLASGVDTTSTVWHKRHIDACKLGGFPLTSLSLAHTLNVLDRRVFFAREFSGNSPLRPGMRLGFYDTADEHTSPVSYPNALNRGFADGSISLRWNYPQIARGYYLLIPLQHQSPHHHSCRGQVQGLLSRWKRTRKRLVLRITEANTHTDDQPRSPV